MKSYTFAEVSEIVSLAEKYLDKENSSAVHLLKEIMNTPNMLYNILVYKSIKSLSYSVGICSPVYKKAWEIARYDGEIRLVNIVQ
jgi:hypothetical protein